MLISAYLMDELPDPAAVAVADSVATRFADDPRAIAAAAKALTTAGAYARAVSLLERAIAIDSAAEPPGSGLCLVCPHLEQLGYLYLWWDSLDAASRTARRSLSHRPDAFAPLHTQTLAATWRGDSASAYASFRRMLALNKSERSWKLYLDLRLGDYATFLRDVPQLLSSASPSDWGTGAWLTIIALRNLGRLDEATRLHRTGALPWLPKVVAERSPDEHNVGILAYERGDYREAARAFRALSAGDLSSLAPGERARRLTWQGTLSGMALAAAGDTTALRALADSVERWGRGSLYGRDQRSHHYLRGMLQSIVGDHAGAVREFREAIHSPSLGFTRVNYELARCLLALDRPSEAVAALQPALRGELDASNLYITRTELHELLAQAFDRGGQRDSAAAHYRVVANAWRQADAQFRTRYERAAAYIAR
jgi:tetratricopeptide (TPR) repeat protein